MSTAARAGASKSALLTPVPRVERGPASSRSAALGRSERRRRFTEQLTERRTPGDLRLNPVGDIAAFTVARMDDSGTATSVWFASPDGPPRRIAGIEADASASAPSWSPDGKRLAVAVQRPQAPLEAQIVVLEEPFDRSFNVGTATGHVEDLIWTADGERLLMVCASPGADSVVTAGAVRYAAPSRRNRPTVTRPGSGQRRVYEMAVSGSRPRALGPRKGSVWDFGLCADGTIAVIWSEDSSESGWYDSMVGVLNRQTGEVDEIYRPGWQLSPLAVAPTGSRIAVVEGWSSDRGRVCGDVRIVDLTTAEVTEMTWFGVDVVSVSWRTENSLWFSGWSGMQSAWGWVAADGSVGMLRHDNVQPDTIAFPAPGFRPNPLVWAANLPLDGASPDIVVGAAENETPLSISVTRLSRGHIAQLDQAATTQLSWQAADGLRIDGLLAIPARGGQSRAPLVIYAHGGPAGLWNVALPIEVRFLIDAGFAVLLPNPRGSVGRGQDFARANLGDAGGAELSDLVGGIDACSNIEGVDTDKVGIVGGSYGGYLAACAAAMTDRFACAVMMFGHPDLLSARYGSNNPAFYDKLMLGPPASGNAAAFVERSPIIHVTTATSPTLLLHGAEDRCSPLGQAEEMYRALIDCHIDTKLVVYPDEGHGLHSVTARSDCWARTADWLGLYLGREPT